MSGHGIDRRRFLRGLGLGAAAIAGRAGCSPRAAVAAPGSPVTGRRGSSGGSGAKPAAQPWYHQYGEAGTQQAVERYAKEYPRRDGQGAVDAG